MTDFQPTGKEAGYLMADFDAILVGGQVPPNFSYLSPGHLLGILASGPVGEKLMSGRVLMDLHETPYIWGRYALGTTQGGLLDGTGFVFWYEKGQGRGGHFTLCKHEKVEGPEAYPMRGWHPGHCRKCGLDMTVDSGD